MDPNQGNMGGGNPQDPSQGGDQPMGGQTPPADQGTPSYSPQGGDTTGGNQPTPPAGGTTGGEETPVAEQPAEGTTEQPGGDGSTGPTSGGAM